MNTVLLKIKRQDDPEDIPYWEEFAVEAPEGSTVLSALSSIGENPENTDGSSTAPVVFESSCLEGMCGACSMIINGRVRLACKTLVSELDSPVKIEPLGKFPVLRDLKTDRAAIFNAVAERIHHPECVLPHSNDPALRISPETQRRLEIFSTCVMCGSCTEACPQAGSRTGFAGAFLFAKAAVLLGHPVSSYEMEDTLSALSENGGLSDCSGARACESVCPNGIPLSEAASRLGWAATVHSLRKLTR